MGWTSAENLAPTLIRSPDHPARSESLYGLRYPGPPKKKHIRGNDVITQPNEIKYFDDPDSLGFRYGVQFAVFFLLTCRNSRSAWKQNKTVLWTRWRRKLPVHRESDSNSNVGKGRPIVFEVQ